MRLLALDCRCSPAIWFRFAPTRSQLESLALLVFICMLGLAAPSAAAQPSDIERIDVPLIAWVNSRGQAGPDTLASFEETNDRLSKFEEFTASLVAARWTRARAQAERLRYEIVAITEEGYTFVVASDRNKAGRGPTVVINTAPRIDLVLQAPHASFEPGTAEEALSLMRDLGARASLIARAHRCASRAFSSCSGRTTVCGRQQAFRDSDVGHNPETLFHVAHAVLAEAWPHSIVVSLHGMRQDEAGKGPRIIVSSGALGDDVANSTAATQFRIRVGARLTDPAAIVSCNFAPDRRIAFRKLCGSTNVQGRHLNGATDACLQNADTGSGRFIHLEQDPTVLRPFAYNWANLRPFEMPSILGDALKAVAPTVPAP